MKINIIILISILFFINIALAQSMPDYYKIYTNKDGSISILNHGIRNPEYGEIEGIQFKDEAFGFVHTAAAVKREDFIYVVGYVKVSDDFSTTYNKMLSTFNFSI